MPAWLSLLVARWRWQSTAHAVQFGLAWLRHRVGGACLLSHRTRARSSPCTQVGQRPRAATRSDRVRVRPARAGSAALAASSSSGTALSLEAARVALAHTKAACIWGLACASAPSRRWRALARASARSRRLRPSCRSAAFSPGACTPASPPRARAAHLSHKGKPALFVPPRPACQALASPMTRSSRCRTERVVPCAVLPRGMLAWPRHTAHHAGGSFVAVLQGHSSVPRGPSTTVSISSCEYRDSNSIPEVYRHSPWSRH